MDRTRDCKGTVEIRTVKIFKKESPRYKTYLKKNLLDTKMYLNVSREESPRYVNISTYLEKNLLDAQTYLRIVRRMF